MMEITLKWLLLHPCSTTEDDTDQKQKLAPKAVQPVLQLKGLEHPRVIKLMKVS